MIPPIPVTDWKPYDPCPCGCGFPGWKLQKNGHAIGCSCSPCRNRRNQRKGKAGQAKGHRALGGVGFTPSQEESTGGYPIRVQVEWKTGAQIPKSVQKFLGLEWTRHALRQADLAVRVGDGAMPAVGLVIGGKTWLIVECDRSMDGVA